MAKQEKVPKFGNWEDSDEVPYTQYFENARKAKIAGRVINPNDPEENSESFEKQNPKIIQKSKDVNEKTHLPPGSPLRHEVIAQRLSDPHRRAKRISAGSDRSLEQSPLHHAFHTKYESKAGVNSPSRDRKSSLEGHGTAPNTPGRSRARTSLMAEKGAAVPKFGEWDETNPASADEFTQIFNQVSEEKQVGSAKVLTTTETSYHSDRSSSNRRVTPRCGCFAWLMK